MGGPGVIMTADVLEKVGPNAPHCLRNHLYSYHEDVEVSRCIRKFAGVNCVWSYETGRKFYEHYESRQGFIDPWLNPYNLKLDYAITLHPNKKQNYIKILHNYFMNDKIRALETEKMRLKREVANIVDILENRLVERLPVAKNVTLNKWKPRSVSVDGEVIPWNTYSAHYVYSVQNTRHGFTGYFKHITKDIIRQLVKSLNEGSNKKGREVEFQQIEYGYFRLDPLHGIDYVIDIRLLYNRFAGRSMKTPVRKHSYIQQTFTDTVVDGVGELRIRDIDFDESLEKIYEKLDEIR